MQTYDDLHADTRKWVQEEWIDYIVPQVYWNIGFAAADYGVLVPWWSNIVSGTSVQLYVGEALYKVGVAGQPAAWQDQPSSPVTSTSTPTTHRCAATSTSRPRRSPPIRSAQ